MRPIFRGSVPTDDNKNPKAVSDYKDWRADLIDRIGPYCSYCDMVLNDSPQVEHVTPKNPKPGQPAGSLLDWDNMLLACGPCNRAKDNNPCPTTTHFLPDTHNTLMAFEHEVVGIQGSVACLMRSRQGLTAAQQVKAQNTIDLCKLDTILINPRATDHRWKKRYEALVIAVEWRQGWDSFGHKTAFQFISLLNTAASGKGFFSIWYDTFHDVPAVLESLITAFPNTERSCFDAVNGYAPIPRNTTDL